MSKTKFPRALAMEVAAELCRDMKPPGMTDRLIVAGSLRRRKDEVGDVEILYIPRIEPRPDPQDLLGNMIPTNLVDVYLQRLIERKVIEKRLNSNGAVMWGESNKLARHVATGVPVDFFSCNRANWWTLLVCRTGSKENNERICNAAIERGLKWNPYLGFEDRYTSELLHVPQSEQDVFNRVGLTYIEPWER